MCSQTFDAYFIPSSTGSASWLVCGSSRLGSRLEIDGHITADPFTAGTTTPRSLNLVPPPAAGVERYMKKV